jgi:putative oxidoreductase
VAFGLLILRLVVGLLFAAHGAQKLFGSFGGHGLAGTGQFFDSLGIRPGRRNALAAGLAELVGGGLLALGLFTPLATATLVAVMLVAVVTVHAPKGVWATNGGYEYNLVLATAAVAVAATGPGRWSLDHALGIYGGSTGWALTALVVGVLGGLGAVAFGRTWARGHAPRPGRPHAA